MTAVSYAKDLRILIRMEQRRAIRYLRTDHRVSGPAETEPGGRFWADQSEPAGGAPGGRLRADQSEPDELRLPDLHVVQTVRDDQAGRAGLTEALAPIVEGTASVLLVPALGMAARSLRELVALIDWLDEVDGALVAEDVAFDSGSAAGRATVALLREIAGWETSPDPDRPRRGRPGLTRLAPDLVERIAALRSTGMTLQAVADQLNAEGLPTLRGGTTWRPSSVQAALGYRRPRPPAPGAPPLPGPPPHHSGPYRRPAPPHPPEAPRHPDGPRDPDAPHPPNAPPPPGGPNHPPGPPGPRRRRTPGERP